jgi:RND family efflux transporter MFP subunit
MSAKTKKTIQIVLSIFLIAIGFLIARHLILTKPRLKVRKHLAPLPMVKVMKVKLSPHRIIIDADGTVRAVKEISLVSEVAGKIRYVSPSFEEGKLFKQGELLLEINPEDYELAVKMAEAKVKEAESRLSQILAEAKTAVEEWKTYKPNVPPPPLVAKKPQVESAKAGLESAKANLKKALLNLERTRIYAPFDGRIIKKMVDIGEYVTPGKPLALICSSEEVEVVVPVLFEKTKWFKIPGFNAENGSKVEILLGEGEKRIGKVWGAGGKVDPTTRLIPVIIRIKKPFDKKPPLIPGMFVKVRIRGKFLRKALVVPYSYIHQTEDGKWIAWVVDKNSTLRFRKIKVAYRYEDKAVITRGLKNGDLLVISELESPAEGMKVKVFKRGSEK